MKSGHNPSNTAEYYLERAAECERSITAVSTEEDRKALQQLAARWRGFAAEVSGSPPDKG